MTPNPENKLLACPFCGQEPEIDEECGDIFCDNSLCQNSQHGMSKEQWNTRTTPQPPVEHLCIACGKAHVNCCGLCSEWYQPVSKLPDAAKIGEFLGLFMAVQNVKVIY